MNLGPSLRQLFTSLSIRRLGNGRSCALRRSQAVSLAALWLFIGCAPRTFPVEPASESPRAKANSSSQAQTPDEAVGNPFAGADLFVVSYTHADQARRRAERENAEEARLLAKIADTPQAKWFGEWSSDVEITAGNYVGAASKRGKVALLVAYNIPNRDCGQYSAGGAEAPQSYRDWIAALAKGIDSRRAIVVLEPDALAHLTECLSPTDQEVRLQLLSEAVETLTALPRVAVYLDAGHSRWVPADEMAERLKRAGIEHARGFALNTSNYIADDELIAYGDRIVSSLGETHYIIDSSRNGRGPTEDLQWCNPAGRALGRPPTADTGHPHLDAYAWLKAPGESDGECAGGPPAGQWFHERALEMARNAAW